MKNIVALIIAAVSVVAFCILAGIMIYKSKKNLDKKMIEDLEKTETKEDSKSEEKDKEEKKEDPKEQKEDPKKEEELDNFPEVEDTTVVKTDKIENTSDKTKIDLVVSEDKSKIEIYNYNNEPLNNVFLSITDGDSDMPIHQWYEFEGLTKYTVLVPIKKFSNISKTLTFDKIQFRMISADSSVLSN